MVSSFLRTSPLARPSTCVEHCPPECWRRRRCARMRCHRAVSCRLHHPLNSEANVRVQPSFHKTVELAPPSARLSRALPARFVQPIPDQPASRSGPPGRPPARSRYEDQLLTRRASSLPALVATALMGQCMCQPGLGVAESARHLSGFREAAPTTAGATTSARQRPPPFVVKPGEGPG
jgi:hypothetical protein